MNTAQNYAPQGSVATPAQPLAALIPQTAKSSGPTPPQPDDRPAETKQSPIPARRRPYHWQTDFLGFAAKDNEAATTLFALLDKVRAHCEYATPVPALTQLLEHYFSDQRNSPAMSNVDMRLIMGLIAFLTELRDDFSYLDTCTEIREVLISNSDNCEEGGANE